MEQLTKKEIEFIEKETGLVYGKDYNTLDDINWKEISQYQKLSEEFIEKHADKVNWEGISYSQKLSESFIEKYADKVNWKSISYYQNLSEPFIEKYQDKVDWFYISQYQKLSEFSEQFIEKFVDKLDWEIISEYQELSEEFIEKYADKVDWKLISESQELSESFIEKYADKVHWKKISRYQKLSEEFIEKHADKVDWKLINEFQELSEEFRQKHADKLNNISVTNNNNNNNNNLTEKNVEYITNDKTIHELENGIIYFNDQGNYFKIFNDIEDAHNYIKGINDNSIKEFDSEIEFNNYLIINNFLQEKLLEKSDFVNINRENIINFIENKYEILDSINIDKGYFETKNGGTVPIDKLKITYYGNNEVKTDSFNPKELFKEIKKMENEKTLSEKEFYNAKKTIEKNMNKLHEIKNSFEDLSDILNKDEGINFDNINNLQESNKNDEFKIVNRDTLTKLKFSNQLINWFEVNIGEYPADKLDRIQGDFLGFISEIKKRFSNPEEYLYDNKNSSFHYTNDGNGYYWNTRTYDENNNLIHTETDMDGSIYWEDYYYDNENNLVEINDSNGQETSFGYNKDKNIELVIENDDKVKQYNYIKSKKELAVFENGNKILTVPFDDTGDREKHLTKETDKEAFITPKKLIKEKNFFQELYEEALKGKTAKIEVNKKGKKQPVIGKIKVNYNKDKDNYELTIKPLKGRKVKVELSKEELENINIYTDTKEGHKQFNKDVNSLYGKKEKDREI